MQEDFLHFVWKYQKFTTRELYTSEGDSLIIIAVGQHNNLSGPDFFNAKLKIGDQQWAGNVEIHLRASDWYTHGHEKDDNYDNVILHVVWEDDVAVFRKDGSQIPTLVLKNVVSEQLVQSQQQLYDSKQFINCEDDFATVDAFIRSSWLERLYIERLEQKSELVLALLDTSQNDWEKVLFCLLMKNFGLNNNGEIFLQIAKAIDFKIFRKVRNNHTQTEALLLGMAGLLDGEESYQKQLGAEFQFLKSKFKLKNELLPKPNFYGLRPNNFPTIRLSQLASVYYQHDNLFQKIITTSKFKDFSELFKVAASTYWDTHFVFGKTTSKRKKTITDNFVSLLIINTIIPLKFCYARALGKSGIEEVLQLAESIKPEKNSIISKFKKIGASSNSVLETQAQLQLYNQYCSKNYCLKCQIGTNLLGRMN